MLETNHIQYIKTMSLLLKLYCTASIQLELLSKTLLSTQGLWGNEHVFHK